MTEHVSTPVENQPQSVFLRNSSGVIRSMSPKDGMFFGYLSAAGLYGVALYAFLGVALFPRASIILALVICVVLYSTIFLVYAGLSSAMPRSGGDYVFTSRILNPGVGFTLGFAGWAFWQFFYAFLAASTIVSGALQPLLSGLGVVYKNSALTSAANALDHTGVRLLVTCLLLVLAGLVMIRGMRVYLRIQNYFMMPVTIIAILVIIGELLFVNRSTFLGHFDHFQAQAGGLPSSAVGQAAAAAGLQTGGFSWGQTWAFSVLLAGAFLWCMWQTELMGEMKSAKSLRNTAGSMLGANFLLFLTLAIGIAWFASYAGHTFFAAFSYMATNQPDKLGGDWGFRGAQTLLGLPAANGVVFVLIFLGFLAPISQSMFNTTLTASRLFLSMAFDRVLPEFFGKVNRRGAPYVAIMISVAVSIVLAIIYTLKSSLTQAIFTASAASLVAMLGTVIAGTIFPFRKKDIYRLSPASSWRIAGLPAITVIGVIATIFLVATIASYIGNDAFGLLTSAAAPGWIVFGAVTAASFIWFYVVKAVRRRSGIRIEYAFDEIPPE